MLGTTGLQGNTQWITFLADAELDPAIFKTKWREPAGSKSLKGSG
jgi:hypothetical protein